MPRSAFQPLCASASRKCQPVRSFPLNSEIQRPERRADAPPAAVNASAVVSRMNGYHSRTSYLLQKCSSDLPVGDRRLIQHVAPTFRSEIGDSDRKVGATVLR